MSQVVFTQYKRNSVANADVLKARKIKEENQTRETMKENTKTSLNKYDFPDTDGKAAESFDEH